MQSDVSDVKIQVGLVGHGARNTLAGGNNHNRLCIMRQSFPPLSFPYCRIMAIATMIITVICYHDDKDEIVSSYFIWRWQQNDDNGDDASQYFIGLQFNEIASGCQMNFGLARKNTGLPSLHFWLFQCIFLCFKNAYFHLSSIAYFSVSKTFMCSAAAALIRIYMVGVGG